jgi:hypothetical protein
MLQVAQPEVLVEAQFKEAGEMHVLFFMVRK